MKKDFSKPGKLYDFVDDYKSPLFRIMSGLNLNDPLNRRFLNNISCVHIGNGYFVSVSHAVKMPTIPDGLSEHQFKTLIQSKVTKPDNVLIEKHYLQDPLTKNYMLTLPTDEKEKMQTQSNLTGIMKKIGLNVAAYYKENILKPYLVINFKENQFYLDSNLNKYFSTGLHFEEKSINRFTFLIELELINSFDAADITLYRAVNIDKSVLKKLPAVEIDFSCYDNNSDIKLFFLQASPESEIGRMITDASIEGIIEQYADLGGFVAEGKRYICQNYFRFGSSGAPYLVYDPDTDKLYLNAIQSQAAPIQMLINNNRDGNQQYTHAIASPLYNIKDEIEQILAKSFLEEVGELK